MRLEARAGSAFGYELHDQRVLSKDNGSLETSGLWGKCWCLCFAKPPSQHLCYRVHTTQRALPLGWRHLSHPVETHHNNLEQPPPYQGMSGHLKSSGKD